MKTALVTGPSSGIGREVTLALARNGFHIVAAGRSPERVGKVVDEIAKRSGSAEALHLDLASLASVREAAGTFKNSGRRLDVVINNAGVAGGRGITSDGFQLQFGVNHLGHFLLAHSLRDTLHPGARILQVSSQVHHRAKGIDFDRLTQTTRSLSGVREYAESKLANILYVRELAKRRPEWSAYAIHPGMADTTIWPWYSKPFVRGKLISPLEAADTIVWCATEPGLADNSGGYFAIRQKRQPSPVALDRDLAGELWKRSEQWCGIGSSE